MLFPPRAETVIFPLSSHDRLPTMEGYDSSQVVVVVVVVVVDQSSSTMEHRPDAEIIVT